MSMTYDKVALTGHRLDDYTTDEAVWVTERLDQLAWDLKDSGTTVGISGMALGADMWWADSILNAGLELHAYVPFPQQPDKWTANKKEYYAELLEQATEVKYFGEVYQNKYLFDRNDGMIEDSDLMLSVWSGKRTGGTFHCTENALLAEKPVWWLDYHTDKILYTLTKEHFYQ